MQAVCLECNALNSLVSKFCNECGASLEAAKVVKGAETTRETMVTDNKKGANWARIILVIIVCIIGAIWIPAQAGGSDRANGGAGAGYVTLDGTRAIQDIKIWNGYGDQAAFIVASGRHDQRVKVIKRMDDAALIELPNGRQGWVSYLFIKEYK